MALPVIPNHPSSELKMSDIADSCNLNQATNISLRGLSINSPSLSYNSNPNVSTLPSGSITISEGFLSAWLVASFGDSSFDQTDANQHKMSEFPVGRSCETAGYLGR